MHTPNAQYHTQLHAFAAKLLADKQSVTPDIQLTFIIESGRRYDRVRVVTPDAVDVAFYFVERTSGEIYGSRDINKLAPNRHHYYGVVYRAHLWDWRGTYGIPASDPTVRIKHQYNDIVFYVPLTLTSAHASL